MGLLVVLITGLAIAGYLGARARSGEERRARSVADAAGEAWDNIRVEPLREVISFEVELVPATAVVVAAPRVLPDEINLVTALSCVQGAQVTPGQVIAEISNRPIFAIPLDLPLHRDLRLGHQGADVARFQSAMGSLGYQIPSRERGVFGFATAAAVVRFYRDRGYVAPEALDPESGRPTPIATRDTMVAVTDVPAVVAATFVQVGHTAPEGTRICELASPIPQIVGRPSATQVKLLRTGQSAQIVLSNGEKVPSEVVDVSVPSEGANPERPTGAPAADEQRAADSPMVLLAPTRTPPPLTIGDRGRVEVVVAESDGTVLSVNVECVRTGANGVSQVELDVRSRGASRVRVDLGPVIGDRVVVTGSDRPLRQGDRCRLQS